MRILQIVLPDASAYERKSQRVDYAALAGSHEVTCVSLEEARAHDADLAHVYAGAELPSNRFVGFHLPYVSSADVKTSRWSLRRPVQPALVVSPAIDRVEKSRLQLLPEAVDDSWFEAKWRGGGRKETYVVGSWLRPRVLPLIDQVIARLARLRDDIRWDLYDEAPTPELLSDVDVWVDPAVDEDDFDGFVAEALVVGLPVVASRTTLNSVRLESGRTGFLTPMGDQNETTHAILTALFKTEAAQQKLIAARQTISRFRARQRARVLLKMYETLTP